MRRDSHNSGATGHFTSRVWDVRTTVGAILFAVGLATTVFGLRILVMHFIYADSYHLDNLVKALAIGITPLILGFLLLGAPTNLFRVISFYVLAFLGLQLAVAPFRQRDLAFWTTTDFTVTGIGVFLFGGCLWWGFSFTRRRKSRFQLSNNRVHPTGGVPTKPA